jgi:hypothetical protein
MTRHERSCSDHTRMAESTAEEKSSRRVGSGWKATKLQTGVGQMRCAAQGVPLPTCPPPPHSLHNTRRAPKVVCPVVPHNVPDTHSPITATCGNVFEVTVCVQSPARILQPTCLSAALPVASSVEVGSKAMVATGAVCIAFHRRVMPPSLQAHWASSSARLAVTNIWGEGAVQG